MKKTLLLLISTTLFFNLQAQKTYQITGQLTNQNNEKITISYFDGEKNVENSTVAADGKFALTGPAPSKPIVVRLNTSVDRNIYMGEQKTSMYIPAMPLELVISEDCKLTVSGNAMELNFATVSGDSYNEGFSKLHAIEAPLMRKMTELQGYLSQAKKMGLTEDLSSIGQQMLEVRKELSAQRKKYISDNPSAFVSAWLLSITVKEYSLTELKAAYDGLTETIRLSTYGLVIAEQIKTRTATENATK